MLFFYQPHLSEGENYLEEEEYRHCVRVLRKKEGDAIGLLDGKGLLRKGTISEITSKKCLIEVTEEVRLPQKRFKNHIAIAPTKSTDRIEWFVEKACELAIDEITFLLTQNSERNKLRVDRLEKKAVSALKQSKNGWLTQINPLIKFTDFLSIKPEEQHKYIAVVEPDLPYLPELIQKSSSVLTLIGPEGDFSVSELALAEKAGFEKVSLGRSTLRTETAGLIACHSVNITNGY